MDKGTKQEVSLVIMAAGIGSRYGAGIKQLERMGPSGEIIMDYSIYDAIRAGFSKVVFIIRHDIEKDFREIIGNRIEKVIDTEYVFQELSDIPDGHCDALEGRKKPWGTGQAILACKGIVNGPFAVINADDYYGTKAFEKVYAYLVSEHPDKPYSQFCMAGFFLGNTLSDNGTVTRGICKVDTEGYLEQVKETYNIMKTKEGAAVKNDDGTETTVDTGAHVSMNMWGLTPDFFSVLERGFAEYLAKLPAEDKKSEFLLPACIDETIRSGSARVKVLETTDQWFGVTYHEDKEAVRRSLLKLIEDGVYPSSLYTE